MSGKGYDKDKAKMLRREWLKCKHTQTDLATEAPLKPPILKKEWIYNTHIKLLEADIELATYIHKEENLLFTHSVVF